MSADKVEQGSRIILGGPTLDELKEALIKNNPVEFCVDPGKVTLSVKVSSILDLQRPGVDRWRVSATLVEDNREIIFYYNFPEFKGLYVFEE